MTGQVLDYLAIYGVPAAAFLLAIGQFGVPLPTSLALLTIGALAANDDADLATAFAAALAGATFGDQAGFLTGRFVVRSAGDRPGFLGGLARKARSVEPHVAKWGASSVFISRWLLTPLGPAINIASGVVGLAWPVFTVWGLAGEILWVSIYIGLGFTFGSNIELLAGILGNLSMALAMLALTAFLGWRLIKAIKKTRSRTRSNRQERS